MGEEGGVHKWCQVIFFLVPTFSLVLAIKNQRNAKFLGHEWANYSLAHYEWLEGMK
jgi:hypothetical protein